MSNSSVTGIYKLLNFNSKTAAPITDEPASTTTGNPESPPKDKRRILGTEEAKNILDLLNSSTLQNLIR